MLVGDGIAGPGGDRSPGGKGPIGVEEAIDLIARIFQCLQILAVPEWVQLQLTMPQLKGLFAIAGEGSPSIGGLARKLGVSLATASTLVEALVGQGYATRREDSDDRRRTLAELTAEGESLVVRLGQGRRQLLTQPLDRLRPEELEGLLVGLRGLGRELGAAEAEAVAGSARIDGGTR